MKSRFKELAFVGVVASSLLNFAGCSSSDDVAGGVTDIGNSVAQDTLFAGRVVDGDGRGVAAARVVAYADDGLSIRDSIETVSDSLGGYVILNDAGKDFLKKNEVAAVFAQKDSLYGLQGDPDVDADRVLKIGKPVVVTGRIEGESSGFVRIVGTNATAEIHEDGTFAFENLIPGSDLQMNLVQVDSVVASVTISADVHADSIVLPAFDGVDQGTLTSGALTLHMDGTEKVFDNDSTAADSVDYVDGVPIAGGNQWAIRLMPGQFIEVDSVNVTDGDFTISLWTKWDGPNGEHQVIVNERAYWSDSTSKFQWHFEGCSGTFTVMKSMPQYPEAIFFGDSSIVPIGEWAHLALVSKDHQVTMYVNGEQVGETQEFVPNQLDKPVPFRIGGDEIDAETWNGVLDEVRIENVARSKEWVKEKYLHTFTRF